MKTDEPELPLDLDALGLPPAEKKSSAQPKYFKPESAFKDTSEAAPPAMMPATMPATVAESVAPTKKDTEEEMLTEVEKAIASVRETGHETTYEAFCAMLKLPATGKLIPLPKLKEEDRLAAIQGGCLMRELERQKAEKEGKTKAMDEQMMATAKAEAAAAKAAVELEAAIEADAKDAEAKAKAAEEAVEAQAARAAEAKPAPGPRQQQCVRQRFVANV